MKLGFERSLLVSKSKLKLSKCSLVVKSKPTNSSWVFGLPTSKISTYSYNIGTIHNLADWNIFEKGNSVTNFFVILIIENIHIKDLDVAEMKY